MYDVIVVGARCSGASTALLLARQGLRVLLVDRARFPSDTVAGHCIWPRGLLRLQRWGLLSHLRQTRLPALTTCRMDFRGDIQLTATFPDNLPVPFALGPRRSVLDQLLVEAASQSGVEVREGCPVHGLLWQGQRVVGVYGESGRGTHWREGATLVIGADGVHSRVARLVRAEKYYVIPAMTCNYYTYWEGVDLPEMEMAVRPTFVVTSFRTHHGLTTISCIKPASYFHAFRADIERCYLDCLHQLPHIWERMGAGRRVESFKGIGPTDSFFRRSFGPGWALVGDAGYYKDPVTGSGISDAFRDAEELAMAVTQGLCGRRSLLSRLAAYERRRNKQSILHYWFTYLASTMDATELELLVKAVYRRRSQRARDHLLSVMTGDSSLYRYVSSLHMPRLLGLGGSLQFARETYHTLRRFMHLRKS